MKKVLAFMLMFVFAVLLASCNQTNVTDVEITGLSSDGSVTVALKGNTTLATTLIGGEGKVVWSIKDESIASVDQNGTITGNAKGNTVLEVSVEGTDIKKQIIVKVNEEKVATKTLTVELSFKKIAVGATTSLRNINYGGTVLKATDVTISVNDPSVVSVDPATGVITGLKAGVTVIKVVYQDGDNKITKNLPITVTNTESDFFVDMHGFKITIAEAGHALGNQDPFLPTYGGLDKLAKQKAWDDVEKEFNCDIEVVAYPDYAPWGPTRINYINDSALGDNTPDYVIYVVTTDWTSQLASGDSVVDVTDYYAKYGSKCNMGEGFKRAGSVNGNLYAIANSDNGVEYGLFYNLKLVKELMDKTPAELFNEGRWTILDFVSYCNELQNKLNGRNTEDTKYYACAGEMSYYWAKMMNASNIAIADVKTMSLNLTGTVPDNIVKALRNIKNTFDPEGGYDASNSSFKNGRAIFCPGDTWFVNGADRWNMTDFEYGFVPYPYDSSISKKDTKVAASGGSCWMIANKFDYSDPSNYTQPGYVASNEDVYKVIMRMYELTNKYVVEADGYDPVAIQREYASKYCDEEAGIEAILFFDQDKILFDPFIGGVTNFYATPGIGAIIRDVVKNDASYQEKIDGVLSVLNKSFQNIYG